MTLIAYEPRHFLDEFFENSGFFPKEPARPMHKAPVGNLKVNISEDENGYHLSAVVPGWTEEEVDIEISNGVLILRGHSEEEKQEEAERYKVREFMRTGFERSFRLGDQVDQDKVAAKMENGVLQVHLPKKEEVKPKTQKVKIN